MRRLSGLDVVFVRPVEASDFDPLTMLWRRSVEATHSFLSGDDVDEIERDIRHHLPLLPDVFVAVDGVRTLGFVGADGNSIEMLFVDPAAQGQGVGSALLRCLTERPGTLVVDVNEQNASGRASYTARGFLQRGRSATDDKGRPFPLLHLELSPSSKSPADEAP